MSDLIKSVKDVDFASPTGRGVNFDVYGNTRSTYSLHNFVKASEDSDSSSNYTYRRVCSLIKACLFPPYCTVLILILVAYA